MRAGRTDRSSLVALLLVCLAGLAAAPAASAAESVRPEGLIDSGANVACGVRSDDGNPYCWGDDSAGVVTGAAGTGPVTSLSLTENHACAVKPDGTPVCWGGLGNDRGQTSPPADIAPVSSVTTGVDFSCALEADGMPVCWGSDDDGVVSGAAERGPFKSIKAGWHHACGIGVTGSVDCWGDLHGTPIPADLGPVTSLAAGGFHTCAVRATDAMPVCWGLDFGGSTYGAAGNGPAKAISAGLGHTCVIKTDGTPVCWGEDMFGQSTGAAGKGPVTDIGAGSELTCAVQPGGTPVCWGSYSDPPEDLKIGPLPPAATGDPSVDAPVWAAGRIATAEPGTWKNQPETYRYSWRRCTGETESSCTAIAGTADADDGDATYTMTGSDTGKRIRVAHTATNGEGSATAVSPPSLVVGAPAATSAPVVSGTTRTGFTLTVAPGDWTNDPTSYDIEWLRCTTSGPATCTAITGTDATNDDMGYKLVNADDGKRIRARVAGRNAFGAGPPTTSAPTAKIDLPTPTAAPVVTGVTQPGQVLTTTRGTWAASPTEFYVEWLRCVRDRDEYDCEGLESEDAWDGDLTYTLTDEDVGWQIRSIVYAGNAVGEGGPAESELTAVVGAPTATKAPVVSGTTRTGFTLTTTNGEWLGTPTGYAVEWLRCTDATSASCTPIVGASGTSYKLVNADDGKRIRSRVVARNAVGDSTPHTSAATAVIDLPVNTVAPVVSGEARTGQALTTTRGTWTGSPTSHSVEWLRCTGTTTGSCVPIESADAADGDLTYTLVAADSAKRIRARVTATNAAGTGAPSASEPTEVIDLLTVVEPPVVSGTTRTGFTLTTTNGEWTGDPTGYTVEWLRCADTTVASCAPIVTAASYKLVDADDGKRIRSRVTARNAGGDSAPSTSAATAVIDLPMNTVAPVVSGATRSGQVLTTTRGTWSGSPTSYKVEWLRCTTTDAASCIKLASADAVDDDLTYTAVALDAGKRIRSRVTATNAIGTGLRVSSEPTVAINAPTVTLLPEITGRTRTGDTLTATTGDWTGTPTGREIEWLRCADTTQASCAPITGATASTYKLVNADDAKRIRVRVVAANANGQSAPATSTATDVIDLPAATVAPVVSGTAAVGQILTTTRGTWTGLPTSHTIEWLKCTTTAASSCTRLTSADATNNDLTYTATAGETGTYIRSRVTASNAGGAGTPSTSAVTAAVS